MKISLLLVVGLLLSIAHAGGLASGTEFQRQMPPHPRLLFTTSALESAKKEALLDPLRQALHERIVQRAEQALKAPKATHIAASNESLDEARKALHTIITCALAYRLNHDSRSLERAKEELLHVCRFPDWNPAHFLDVGELSLAAALGYDWLHDQLNTEERTLVKNAIVEKGLRPARNAYNAGSSRNRFVEWAFTMSNWNQVINGGVLCAALAVADEEPELAGEILRGARASIPLGLKAYAPDGQYPEGPGYWSFGTTYSVIGFAALEGCLGSEFGLTEATGFPATAIYHLSMKGPSGKTFNYADCTEDLQNSPASTWLSVRFRQPVAELRVRELLKQELKTAPSGVFDPTIQSQVMLRFLPLHAIWFPRQKQAAIEGEPRLPLDLHLRGKADLALLRGSWEDPQTVFVGVKAGENAFRHNHLDLGSFVLDADGIRWAVDLGPDSYQLPGYNKDRVRRWDYFRTNNRSHNTLTLANELQERAVIAPITDFGSEQRKAYAIVDLGKVHPAHAKSLRRGIALLDRSRVLVQDEYTPQGGRCASARWVMATRAMVTLEDQGRTALLSQEGKHLQARLLTPGDVHFNVIPANPPTVAEDANEGVSLLIIEIPKCSNSKALQLSVLLTPLGSNWPKLPDPRLCPIDSWNKDL